MENDLPGQVQQILADYLEIRLDECKDLDPAFADVSSELVSFVLGGGKRIRPTFAWWGWRAAGGDAEGPEAVAMLRAASALELIQACALVHDDLIDDSDTRRGNPTIHVRFSDTHRESGWRGQSRHFGAASAILLGDLAMTWADDMLHSAGLAPAALARSLPAWQAMRTELMAGQFLDVLGQARQEESIHAALRIDELKSASYTVRRPLELGAEIGGADESTLTALDGFGSATGVAFQLRDDLLGVFGDPAVTGKPAGDDLREGKRTLLIAEAVERARRTGDSTALDILHSALGNPHLDTSGVERAREVLVRLGAVDAVEERITTLKGQAMTALNSVTLPEPAASKLAELVVTVTDRSH